MASQRHRVYCVHHRQSPGVPTLYSEFDANGFGVGHHIHKRERLEAMKGGVTPIWAANRGGSRTAMRTPLTVPLIRVALEVLIAPCDHGCTLVEVLTQVAESDYKKFGKFEPVSILMRSNPPVTAHLTLEGERLRWVPGLDESDIAFIW